MHVSTCACLPVHEEARGKLACCLLGVPSAMFWLARPTHGSRLAG